MRRFHCALLAAVAVVGFASVASAADMPVKAPAGIAPYNWGGWYIGGNAGYARSTASANYTLPPTFTGPAGSSALADAGLSAGAASSTDLSAVGFTGGLQLGYNMQLRNGWVAGLEIDLNSFRLRNTADTVGFSSPVHLWRDDVHSEVNTDWLMTVRPRIGYSTQQFLIYGTGGLAVTKVKVNQSQASVDLTGPVPGYSESVSDAKIRFGFAIGGGLEYALTTHWSIKGEYQYINFGKFNVAGITTGPSAYALEGNTFLHEFKLNSNVLRAGANYRF